MQQCTFHTKQYFCCQLPRVQWGSVMFKTVTASKHGVPLSLHSGDKGHLSTVIGSQIQSSGGSGPPLAQQFLSCGIDPISAPGVIHAHSVFCGKLLANLVNYAPKASSQRNGSMDKRHLLPSLTTEFMPHNCHCQRSKATVTSCSSTFA